MLVPPVVVRNDELTWKDVCHYLYEENAFDNIVISPGPGSPTCPADIGERMECNFDICFLVPSFSSIIAENSSVKKCLLEARFCDSYTHNIHYHMGLWKSI